MHHARHSGNVEDLVSLSQAHRVVVNALKPDGWNALALPIENLGRLP